MLLLPGGQLPPNVRAITSDKIMHQKTKQSTVPGLKAFLLLPNFDAILLLLQGLSGGVDAVNAADSDSFAPMSKQILDQHSKKETPTTADSSRHC